MADVIYRGMRNKRKTVEAGGNILYEGDCLDFLRLIEPAPVFDLVVTSPPYNIGKPYERRQDLKEYVRWQRKVIRKIYPYIKSTGSICWQVGNYVENGEIVPLDIELAPIFKQLGMKLRNRIIWTYGHGLHSKKRFSGRYEVVLWYTKSDRYIFNLDEVRVPSKYPGKLAYKGPNRGKPSGNPLGKNPSDVWEDIPNVKSNHVEKTNHPCQYPVALIQRLTLALTDEGGLVFDPFCGVASTGVAAISSGRRFWGCDTALEYIRTGHKRLMDAENGTAVFRPLGKPLYDHTRSSLSHTPKDWM